MSYVNDFVVGDKVNHNVDQWPKSSSVLTVTVIKRLVVVAIDSAGRKFIGNFGCFDLVKKNQLGGSYAKQF